MICGNTWLRSSFLSFFLVTFLNHTNLILIWGSMDIWQFESLSETLFAIFGNDGHFFILGVRIDGVETSYCFVHHRSGVRCNRDYGLSSICIILIIH